MIYGTDAGNTASCNIMFHIVMLDGEMLHKNDVLEELWKGSYSLTCSFLMVTAATWNKILQLSRGLPRIPCLYADV